ncbi:hypothetical protein H0H92_012456, partial [Tricholoma furcatifolium]
MSKPATTKPQQPATKPPLSSRSAWEKGPPKSTSVPSPRSQSPAPSHSRRPSTLGQGVPIKDGVTIPPSAVTFGSIDDDSAPISSSPAAAPPIKTEGVKSFGSVPAAAAAPSAAHVNGKPSVSSRPTSSTPPTPSNPPAKLAKGDILKMFQNPSSTSSSSTPSDTSSPSVRPANLAPQPSSQATPTQPPTQQHPSYTPFVPASARPHQPTGPAARTPSSPVYPRQIPNGNPPRPQAGPNSGSAQIPSAGMSSPRLAPHPHNGPPSAIPQTMPPMQPQMPTWPGYYYPPPAEGQYMYGWYPGGQMPPPPHQPAHSHVPPHNGMPMSPRSQPPPLTPGTPTQAHAVPTPAHPQHPPSQHSHTASSSISFTSPPPTPSTATTRLSASSSAFVPGGRPSRVTLKNAEGHEVDIASFTANKPSSGPASGSSSPAPRTGTFRQPSPSSPVPAKKSGGVRIESLEQRQRRLAEEEEKKKEEEGAKAKAEAEEKEKKERERKEKEDKERKEKEEKERKEREEAERIRKEDEDRRKKEEEEKERVKKEAEAEAERLRKEEEEKARLAKEEEQKRKDEEERAKQEAERAAKEAEAEKERLRLEEEAAAKAKAEAEAAATAATTAESTEKAIEEEEGEVQEPEQAASPSSDEPSKDKARGALRIDTATALPTDFPKRIRPGALDLSGAKASNPDMPGAPPSAISLANPIRDLNSVTYPEGIQSPDPKLNQGKKDGLFRYDRDFLMQFMQHCKEKPENLDLNLIGLEANANPEMHPMSRGGSGRHGHRNSLSGAPSSRSSVGLGIGGFGKGGPNLFPMGNFASGSSKLSSEQRFQESSRAVSMGGAQFGRPSPMTRSASQGGVGGTPMSSGRVRSKRGEKRPDGNKSGGYHGQSNAPALTEPVAPLKVSENRWDRKAITADDSSAAVVERKVKSLLNKLTMEKFDSISDQIIEWANKSENQADGNTLMQVIALVFEKATDEATWSEMYARLCRKMMERISSS